MHLLPASSNAQQISSAEYLKEIGVPVLTPENRRGVAMNGPLHGMEQVQSLNRPRGMVFASLPYVSRGLSGRLH